MDRRTMLKKFKALQERNPPKPEWETIYEWLSHARFTESDLETFIKSCREAKETIEEYFARFSPEMTYCLLCEQKLMVKWTLVHGEAECISCGYPSRAYHRDIGPIQFLSITLQYHPDQLSTSKR